MLLGAMITRGNSHITGTTGLLFVPLKGTRFWYLFLLIRATEEAFAIPFRALPEPKKNMTGDI